MADNGDSPWMGLAPDDEQPDVSSIADARSFAVAKPIPEATAAAVKEAVLKKSLREAENGTSSFDMSIWAPR